MVNRAPFNQCIECDEIITNPICSDCLASQMRVFVKEHDQELATDILGFDIEGETQCISCGKKTGLCPHCFSKDIYEFIQERNPILADEFASRFDFQLREMLIT
ncbi:hypothetical protein HYX14_01110 [Candidatus Woesearchaeota archaeon]|nr:hypothetical protein [Candidatus Woesearchaeota archaeon]